MRKYLYLVGICLAALRVGAIAATSPWVIEREGKWPEHIRGPANDVAVSGNRAYVAAGGAGLMILDLTDPQNPTRIGGYDTPGDALAVAVSNSVVYVADGAAGLRVIDATDPANPVSTAAYPTEDLAIDVALNGSIACLAAGEAGFIIFDATDIRHPFRSGSASAENAGALAMAGDYLYVGDEKRFRVFDISNPVGAKIALGTRELAGTISGIALEGNFAYAASGSWGITRIDISDRRQPKPDSFAGAGIAVDIAVHDQIVYTASDASGLIITDFSDPLAPQRVGGSSSIGLSEGVALFGKHALMANGPWGLAILDLSNFENPEKISTFDTDGSPEHVAIAGRLTVLCDGFSGVQIIDTSNPASPQRLTRLETKGRSRSAAVERNHLFVSTSAGVEVFDIADPVNARPVGFYSAPGADLRSISVQGNWVFAGGTHLQVINAQNPVNPLLDSALSVNCDEMVLSGDRLFILNRTEFLIYNVVSPEAPVRLSRFLAATLGIGGFSGVSVKGDFAYIVGTEGLFSIDVSNPNMPVRRGGVAGVFFHIATDGQRAFVTDGSSLKLFDLTNPESPSEIASHNDPNRFYTRVAASGNRAFVLTRSPSVEKRYAGLEIFSARGAPPSLRISVNKTVPELVLTGVARGRYAIDHTSAMGDDWIEISEVILTNANEAIVPTPNTPLQSSFYRARLLP